MRRDSTDGAAHLSPSRPSVPVNSSIWSIENGEAGFPLQLAGRWSVLHALGSREILARTSLGLVCSVQCPGSVVMKTFDAIRQLRDAGIVIVGGFHSPMEQECVEFLLRGEQPVIAVLARELRQPRLPASWRVAIDSGRLLVLSPFSDREERTTKATSHARNEFVGGFAAAVLIPHASPGGKAEAIARSTLKQGKPLFTFDDEDNQGLLGLGAYRYSLEEVRRAVTQNNL